MPSIVERNQVDRQTKLQALVETKAMYFAKAQELCTILALEFGIRAPKVQATLRRPCFACILENTINLAAWALTETNWERVTIHEFAHILQYSRPRPGTRRHHGVDFSRAIHDVAKAWYRDPRQHPWAKEYNATTRAYARRAGLYTATNYEKTKVEYKALVRRTRDTNAPEAQALFRKLVLAWNDLWPDLAVPIPQNA